MMLPKTVVILFISLLFFFNASAFDTLKVTAVLDTALKQVSGVVEYKLPSNRRLSTFEFQLFPNVYSSADPYLKGKPGLRRRLIDSKKWGSMAVDSILVNGKNRIENCSVEYTRGILALDKNTNAQQSEIKLYFRLSCISRQSCRKPAIGYLIWEAIFFSMAGFQHRQF